MILVNNLKISGFTEYTFKIPLRLRWINKLRSNMDICNSWKYDQLCLNFDFGHIY